MWARAGAAWRRGGRLGRRCYCAARQEAGSERGSEGEAGAERGSEGEASSERGSEGEAGSERGEQWARRVVSGVQPTGALHLGNYFGCVRRLVRAQDAGEHVTVFIADLHALTAPPAQRLAAHSLELGAALLAAGLHPDRSVVFAQSAVPRHAELCWALCCLTSQARLAQLPQYRERAAGGDALVGALLYPVLQAADVLVHRGTHVPVGADQLQHLQLAAHLARAFRRHYGPAFPVPRPLLPDDGSDRLRSLRAPDRKMSKSDKDGKSRVLLTDSDDEIRRKIRKAVTDLEPRVTFEPIARPGVSNLVRLHCLAADLTPEEAVAAHDALTTAQYKAVVAEALCGAVRAVRARAEELLRRPRLVRDALRAGARRARLQADQTHADVARRLGLTAPPPPLLPAELLARSPDAAAGH